MTHPRRRVFSDDATVNVLRNLVLEVRQRLLFAAEAWVVLPDHIHAVWTLPEGDADFSKRWRLIKAAFAKRVVAAGLIDAGVPIWQTIFWEHRIRDKRISQRTSSTYASTR